MYSQEKPKSKILLMGILLVSGFVIGWSGSKYLRNHSIVEFESVENGLIIQEETVQKKTENQIEALASGASQNEISSPDLVSVSALSERAGNLLELILADSANHQLTASRIIEYLTLRFEAGSHGVLKEKTLRKLLREVPEVNYALIDQYSEINKPDIKAKLAFHLMINNMSQRPFLEPKLIEKVKLGEDRSEMLSLLGDWGLQAKSSIGYLTQELPYLEEPQDVGSVIRAIAHSSWVSNSALMPADMEKLSAMMSEYRNSEHAEIRAAGVAALRAFPTEDYQKLVLNSFDDPSEQVRDEAIQLYSNNPFQSNALESKLMEILQDPSRSYAERSSLASQLENINISDEQMRVVKSIKKEIKEYVESLSEQERHALYSQ